MNIEIDSESESDLEESTSENEGTKKVLTATKEENASKNPGPKKLVKSTKKKIFKKSEEKPISENPTEGTVKVKRAKKLGLSKEKENEEEKKNAANCEEVEDEKNSTEPKGCDFDLNEIRSELKGIDKAVKVNAELVIPETSKETPAPVTTETKMPSLEEPVCIKSVTSSPSSEVVKEEKEEVVKVAEEPPIPEKKDVKDDIYEFKEPEPFEYQEILRPINRVFEEGDRSPEKIIKKPIVIPEKRDVCKFEVDVKSRFRKTIGKKMKEGGNNVDAIKECNLKIDKPEALPKIESFLVNDHFKKSPEKEMPLLKTETEVQRSVTPPEPVRIHSAVTEEV